MPFQDLPYRHKKRAPAFDDADPARIWQYFEDLELLFQKHSISDNAEKKKATVNYTSVTVEQLWKYVPTFSKSSGKHAFYFSKKFLLFLTFGENKSASFWYFSGVIFYDFCMILLCSKVTFNFIKHKKK